MKTVKYLYIKITKKIPKELLRKILVKNSLLYVLGFLLGACLGDEPAQLFDSFCDPKSDACLEVFYRPPFGFGSHTLLIYGKSPQNGPNPSLIFQTELYNDGALLAPFNIQVDWVEKEKARLGLWGNEQDSVFYYIHVGDSYSWEEMSDLSK